MVRTRGLYSILKRTINLWSSDKTKAKEFRFLGVANCGKVNVWEKLRKISVVLVRSTIYMFLVLSLG